MRKQDFCLCENKGTDLLRSSWEADQSLCFHYMDSTIPPLLMSKNIKLLTFFWDCTGQFVSDRVEIPEDRFSWVAPQI